MMHDSARGHGRWTAHARDDSRPRTVGIVCFVMAGVLTWPAAVLWGQASAARSVAASTDSQRVAFRTEEAELDQTLRSSETRLDSAAQALERADASLAEIAAAQGTTDLALAGLAAAPAGSSKNKKRRQEREALVAEARAAVERQRGAAAAWNGAVLEGLVAAEAPR